MILFAVSNMTTHYYISLCVLAQINIASCICCALLTLHERVVGAFSFALLLAIPGHLIQPHLPLVADAKLW